MYSCYVTSYETWKNFSPLQLEDLCKQSTVSLGYPNLKEEQKRVVTSCLAEKTATAHAEDIHASGVATHGPTRAQAQVMACQCPGDQVSGHSF